MKQMQKALAATEKGKLEIVEIAIPEPDDYEVLVENEGCVFCNTTDRMIIDNLFNTPDYPVVIGHECFGHVIKIGKKVTKYKLGDRVICSNAIINGYDGKYYSTWGGFAKYGISGDLDAYIADHGEPDEANRYRRRYSANYTIANDLPIEKAALAFPLAEASSAIKQVGDITGKTVVVIGTGVVGFSFTMFAKLYGAKKVIALGIIEEKLEISKKLGADETYIDVDEARDAIIASGGADIVFECCGNWRALEKGLPYLKKDGLLAVFAVPKQPYSFDIRRCPINFRCQLIDPAVHVTIDETCKMLAEDKIPVDILLTHKCTLDEAPTAFERILQEKDIKSLVIFD